LSLADDPQHHPPESGGIADFQRHRQRYGACHEFAGVRIAGEPVDPQRYLRAGVRLSGTP